jgi:hypothetical protein
MRTTGRHLTVPSDSLTCLRMSNARGSRGSRLFLCEVNPYTYSSSSNASTNSELCILPVYLESKEQTRTGIDDEKW